MVLDSSSVCFDPHKVYSKGHEAKVDAFLELHCFLHDPPNVDNLISSLEDDPSIFEGIQYAPQ